MRSIALHVVPTEQDCPGCLPGEQASPCQVGVQERQGPLQCTGPSDEVNRVLNALENALAPWMPHLSSSLSVVQALHLGPDEAELVLTVPPHCAGAHLNEAAFHTLRMALPDRDIYVKHIAR